VLGEGEASVRWLDETRTFPNSTRVSLRRPQLVLSHLHYGPMAQGTMTSLRISPAIIGLGLLAAVQDDTLRVLADPQDLNHDGIRGRLNHVWDWEANQTAVGRFGLKANQPNLRQEVAAALIGDMGITSKVFPQQNCTAIEEDCARVPASQRPEIGDDDLATLVDYVGAIAPPSRRPAGSQEAHGEILFNKIGCAGCHMPTLTAGPVANAPQAAGVDIHPYTDTLLHDMGEDLADGGPDFEANGRDWRTAPLWGIGLAPVVVEHPTYLHDGRARDLCEAILWHGGEAANARDAFARLDVTDREAVIAFLKIL